VKPTAVVFNTNGQAHADSSRQMALQTIDQLVSLGSHGR
jgi:hypothetical protein